MATGSASITSRTRRWSIRSEKAAWASAERAAWARKMPMKISHTPVKPSDLTRNRPPTPTIPQPATRPSTAANRVAR
jgi:hypothetical protein